MFLRVISILCHPKNKCLNLSLNDTKERHTAYKLGLNRNLPPLVYGIRVRPVDAIKGQNTYCHILHTGRQLIIVVTKEYVKQEAIFPVRRLS
jgi:hypothetical protein